MSQRRKSKFFQKQNSPNKTLENVIQSRNNIFFQFGFMSLLQQVVLIVSKCQCVFMNTLQVHDVIHSFLDTSYVKSICLRQICIVLQNLICKRTSTVRQKWLCKIKRRREKKDQLFRRYLLLPQCLAHSFVSTPGTWHPSSLAFLKILPIHKKEM